MACLSAVLVLSITSVTACVLYNDEGFTTFLHHVKDLVSFSRRNNRRKKPRKKVHASTSADTTLTVSDDTPWEEIFTVADADPPDNKNTRTLSSPRDGACIR